MQQVTNLNLVLQYRVISNTSFHSFNGIMALSFTKVLSKPVAEQSLVPWSEDVAVDTHK